MHTRFSPLKVFSLYITYSKINIIFLNLGTSLINLELKYFQVKQSNIYKIKIQTNKRHFLNMRSIFYKYLSLKSCILKKFGLNRKIMKELQHIY